MIGTAIENPEKSAPVKVRVVALTNYMAQPQNENKEEKCIHFECRNFIARTAPGQQAEMISLAEEAPRSRDPIDHWMLSWPVDEKPTIEQAREAIEIFLESVGMVDHQCMWALHDDTKDRHLHLALNRVDPVTRRVTKINKGFDKLACQKAVALIEHIQGWRPEKNALYEIVDGGAVLKVPETERVESDEPSQRAIKMERYTGQKSAERIGKEIAAPIIKSAGSWAEVHAGLAAVAMEYKRGGGGARVYVGSIGVKASAVDPAASFGALQNRLGPFQPAREIAPHEYHHHTPQPYPIEIGAGTSNSMRRLSEQRLARAPSSEEEGARRAGVLQINALSDRLLSARVRREAGRDTGPDAGPDTGPLTGIPLHGDQPGWHEYRALRSERDAKQARAMRALEAEQERERARMVATQKREREHDLAGSWSGRGAQRNALEAALAAKHKKSRSDLSAIHKRERQAARAQRPALPSYREWCAAPMILLTPTRVPHTAQSLDPQATAQRAQCALFVASLTCFVDDRGRITYKMNGKALFRDAGRQIEVLDAKNAKAIAAALSVAREKFGATLTLTGPHDFQLQTVEISVSTGCDCRFYDVKLERLRVQLVTDRRHRLTDDSKSTSAAPSTALSRPSPQTPQVPQYYEDDEDDENRQGEAPGTR